MTNVFFSVLVWGCLGKNPPEEKWEVWNSTNLIHWNRAAVVDCRAYWFQKTNKCEFFLVRPTNTITGKVGPWNIKLLK